MLREMEFLRDLRHANISSCTMVSLSRNQLFVFFKYSAYTLLQAVNPQGLPTGGRPLPADVVRRLMYQIVRGVACCHGKGVVHRNIKPKVGAGPRGGADLAATALAPVRAQVPGPDERALRVREPGV
jgi:serine/threonine protein kinase